ncbi:hypothetical protein FHR70_004040 [Microvirga lupini]|uniref:Uncharacterized protein n=1 Tax=Microvirga lupini TaxID=420324 RepID=A0A7W4VPJ8_9HYPH|nr:hypothetical protein [Microvirga lupini]
MPSRTEMVLRVPVHGYAKRVDDAVARAMAILRARDDPHLGEASPVPTVPMSQMKRRVSPRDTR